MKSPVLDEKTEVTPRKVLAEKKHDDIEVISIPTGATAIRIRLGRFDWPKVEDLGKQVDSVVWVDPWRSFDGGATWEYMGGFGADGGQSPPHWKTGLPQEESGRDYALAEPENPGRMVRLEITAHAPIETKVTCFATDAKTSKEIDQKMGIR